MATSPIAKQKEAIALPPDQGNDFDSQSHQKWRHDIADVMTGRKNRQVFINGVTDAKKLPELRSGFFINDQTGNARFTDGTDKYPYVDKNYAFNAFKRKISNVASFRAYQSIAQVFPNAVGTVAIYDVVVFDEDSAYNSTTGIFTPKQAGKYLITATIGFGAAVVTFPHQISVQINRNAVSVNSSAIHTSNAIDIVASTSTLLDMNGTTDNIFIAGFHNFGAPSATGGTQTHMTFSAFKVN